MKTYGQALNTQCRSFAFLASLKINNNNKKIIKNKQSSIPAEKVVAEFENRVRRERAARRSVFATRLLFAVLCRR